MKTKHILILAVFTCLAARASCMTSPASHLLPNPALSPSRLSPLLSAGQQQSNQISAANTAGFSAPPSSGSPWTTGSYVTVNSLGTGPQTMFVSVNSASGSGTLGVYASLDGKVLAQLPNAIVSRVDTGAVGALSASASAVYTFAAPPGTIYIAASAWTSGSVTIAAVAGPAITPISTARSNGLTVLTTLSANPATGQPVTTTPAAWVTNSGTSLPGRVGVDIANYGSQDLWISPINSPIHFLIVPAGTDRWIYYNPSLVTLYIWCASGTTTYDATEGGY